MSVPESKEKKKNYGKWIGRGILTLLLLVYLWSAYPGYLFHDSYVSQTNSTSSVCTEILSDSVAASQYFTPQLPWLGGIQFAAEFVETETENQHIEFGLYKESGEIILSRNISLSDMESGCYYEVAVDKKLKPGKTYYWSVSSPIDASCGWKIMYTDSTDLQAPENSLFLVGDDAYGGENAQTISQYRYYIHKDKSVIIAGCWLGGILVYIVCLEIVDRIFNRIADKTKK